NKLQTLYTLSGKKNLALDLFRRTYIDLLDKFGNPHRRLPPVIHVAGTNGKGSTIAMLRAIYEAAGYKVHVYTSPHLIRFNERIVLAGKQITDDHLESLIDETLALNNDADATFFEAATAMAFAAFTHTPADLCLIEVGLGGRLDCTNIIEKPALSIITKIAMDHTDYLGDTIAKIAGEKAGIIKQNVPCVIAAQSDDGVYAVFEGRGAPIIRAKPYNKSPALTGDHQIKNADTVLTAIEALQHQFPVTNTQIEHGLQTAHWPARLQSLNIDGREITLDGGHNEDAGQALAAHLKAIKKPVHLVLCMMKHKDPQSFLKPMLPYLASITCTQIPNEPSSLSAQDLKTQITPICGDIPVHIFENYKTALTAIDPAVKPQDDNYILIAGSLYLAGEVLRDLDET
ncbi:MAG: bifunctional folylpolyglutamate synthase/dihydrofolate synthase, partial [Bdellovibrionales bacterium]